MNSHLRESAPPLLAFALMFACAAGWALGPRGASAEAAGRAQERREGGEPEVAVYGRVVYEGSGRPVRRARVLLLRGSMDGRASESVTDGRGEFRFRGVRPGRYLIAVDQPGLLSPVSLLDLEDSEGSIDSSGVAKYFDLFDVDGKADKEVTVRARRGAALSGRVTYADGEPATGITVHIMRREGGQLSRIVTGVSRAAVTGGVRTDDRGSFRVAGLPPGEYLLAVSEAAAHGGAGDRDPYSPDYDYSEDSASNYLLLTFHPSASRPRDATAVKVEAGDEHEGVNIVIPERELRTLTGVVRARRDGRPLPNVSILIARRDEEFGPEAGVNVSLSRNGVKTDEQGRWQLRDIPDGAYRIFATPPVEYERPEGGATGMNANFTVTNANVVVSNTSAGMNYNSSGYVPPRPRKRYVPARLDVQVGAAGNELEIELADSGRISGVFSVEGGKESATPSRVYAVRVWRTRDISPGESVFPAQLSADGFVIEGLPPGEYFIRHGFYEAGSSRLYLKSVIWDGRDFMREPLTVGDGQEVEGVRVVFSSEVASLRVRVAGADKRPAARTYVLLTTADSSKPVAYAQQSYCTTDQDGVCDINAPPGEYAVVAVRLGKKGVSDAAWKSLMEAAPRVTLSLGEPKTLDITMSATR